MLSTLKNRLDAREWIRGVHSGASHEAFPHGDMTRTIAPSTSS